MLQFDNLSTECEVLDSICINIDKRRMLLLPESGMRSFDLDL